MKNITKLLKDRPSYGMGESIEFTGSVVDIEEAIEMLVTLAWRAITLTRDGYNEENENNDKALDFQDWLNIYIKEDNFPSFLHNQGIEYVRGNFLLTKEHNLEFIIGRFFDIS